jgi:Na+-transporting NADH:ubiquinone oxidoreductase subunit NqrB
LREQRGYVSTLKQLLCDFRRLLTLEAKLAKAELRAKTRNASVGVALLVAALLLAPLALAALVTTAILALALVLPGWAAALIVAFILIAVVAAMIGVGAHLLRSAVPPLPREAIDGAKEDLRWLTRRQKSAPK